MLGDLIGSPLEEMNKELTNSGRFNAKRFEDVVTNLQSSLHNSAISHREMGIRAGVRNEAIMAIGGRYTNFRIEAHRLDGLLDNLREYTQVLGHRGEFFLNADLSRNGQLNTRRRIRIGNIFTRSLGFLLAIPMEFFFSERLSAATPDDFDVEVSPEEYNLFYTAVEMERDRLLPYLENSDNPEDRDLALEIRSEIEERE